MFGGAWSLLQENASRATPDYSLQTASIPHHSESAGPKARAMYTTWRNT
jgi:hypothetical protein